MYKPGVCHFTQSSGVVMLMDFFYFAFNSCIVELYTRTDRFPRDSVEMYSLPMAFTCSL